MNNIRKSYPIIAILVILLAVMAGAGKVNAQTGLTISVEAGIDGYCKANHWLPVRFTIENTGPGIDGELYVGLTENLTDWQFRRQVSLPSVSRKEITIYAYPPGNRPSEIEIGLVARGELLHQEVIPVNCLSPTDKLLGVWAQNPSLFNPQTDIGTAGNRAVLLILDDRTIPDKTEGLSMLSALTISNVDSSRLTSKQREAVLTWIANGGILLITGGPNWIETAAAWQEDLPFYPSGTASSAGLAPLHNLAPSSEPLDATTVISIGSIAPDAQILAGSSDVPLITQRKLGFGAIIFLAADPALEPLRTWTGIGALYDTVLEGTSDRPPWSSGFQDWNGATEALNTIEGLGMPHFVLICGFILLYIAIVGPVNFIILRKRNRRDAAWISVPVLVVTFTGIILLISFTTLGNRPVVNRLSLVQVWPGTKESQVHGLVGVFSPQRETFTFEMGGSFISSPLPPLGFGADGRLHEIYQEDSGFSIRDLRVDVGGLQGIVVSGQIPSPVFDISLEIKLNPSSNPVLLGEIRNNSDLTLHNAVLLSGARPQQFGDIAPGESISVSANFSGSFASSAIAGPNPGIGSFAVDETMVDLFGTNYMYPSRGVTVETYRRFNLMTAALGGVYNSRGGGIYLVGWTDQAPFETNLSGSSHLETDTTLYIIHIDPQYLYAVNSGDRLVLPPGMFSWSLFESPTGNVTATPYEGYLGTGSFSLRFFPRNPLGSSKVEELTLHLESYGQSGPSELKIQLWDFSEATWSTLPALSWGDTNISSPERFVGADGEVRIKLENTTLFSISVERVDFTLTMLR